MVAILKKILLFVIFFPSLVLADSIIDDPLGEPVKKVEGVQNLIERLQNFVFVTAGGIAITMIIWGAIILLTAGGNEERVEKGKKILTYSIGGVFLIIASYIIIRMFIALLGGGTS